MILKKPYAFLIKYFRVIHLLLLIPIIYLIIKTGDIVNFFTSYVNAGYYTEIINISSTFINYFMYFAVLFVLFSGVAIYFLMRKKEKSTKFYFLLIIFYLILLIAIGVTHSILSNMELNTVDATTARAFKDVAFIFYLPQYIFALYTLMRGIGFDIKKFNFELDLKELEITDVDNEEFEFNIGFENYKVKRGFRRFIREFRYYVKENKFIFSILVSIGVIILGTLLYLNISVYNQTYQQSQIMNHNNMTIKVTGSILTNRDYKGVVLKDNKTYLVLRLFIENKGKYPTKLDIKSFSVDVNGRKIYPTLDQAEYFIDYALPIKQETELMPSSSNSYVLAYELKKDEIKDDYELKILEQVKISVGDISGEYKTVKLKPEKALEVKTVEEYKLGKIATFEESQIGFTTFQIIDYKIENSLTYQYRHCYDDSSCRDVTEKVSANESNQTLLILNSKFNLDYNTLYYKAAKTDKLFANHFITIEYTTKNITKVVNVKNVTNQYINGFILQTNNEIKTAEHIKVLVTIRDKKYVMNLK